MNTALKRPVEDMTVQPIVLARTNIGTHSIWTEAAEQESLLATLPLMHATVRGQVQREGQAKLSQFSADMHACLEELRTRSTAVIGHEFADLHWVGVNLPIVEMDERALMRIAIEWT